MVPDQALELLLLERGLLPPEELMRLRGVREEAARRGTALALAMQLMQLGVPAGEVPALQAEAAARARSCPHCRRLLLVPPPGVPVVCPGCGANLAAPAPGASGRMPAVSPSGLVQSIPGSSARIPAMGSVHASGRMPAVQLPGSTPGTGQYGAVMPGSAPGSTRLPAVAPMGSGHFPRPGQMPPSTAAGDPGLGEDDEWSAGRRIGRYELLEELGRGAMGAVYLVQPADEPGHEMALKLLLGGDMASPNRRKRFEDEVRLLMRLDHPNLIKVRDWGLADGLHPYYVMDFVPGRDLRQLIKEGAVPVRDAVRIVLHLSRAVHHAHSHGVLHRDLKPDNVRVKELDLSPTLIDFGLAKDLEQDSGLTRSGVALGTPHYMAPEQAEGRLRDVDARTDVWALGVILYELLVGHVPFSAQNMNELARKIAREEPDPLRKQRPEISKVLEAVVLRALRKKPEERWHSAAAFADALQAALDGRRMPGRGGVSGTAVAAMVILFLGGAVATLVGTGMLSGTPRVQPPTTPPTPSGPSPQEVAAKLAEVRGLLDKARAAESLTAYRGHVDQAERLLGGLLAEGEQPELRLLRGTCRRELDRWAEAREDLAAAAAAPQPQARALLALGMLDLRWTGRRADALEMWRRVAPPAAGPGAGQTSAAERAAALLAAALRTGLEGDLAAARRGVEAVLTERPEPEVAADALCALAWVLSSQVARGADAPTALTALLGAERLFRAPRFRYEYALDRGTLLACAGQEAQATQASEELRLLSREGMGAHLVEAHQLRAQRRYAQALAALEPIRSQATPQGVDRADVETLARALDAEARNGARPPDRPLPPPPDRPPPPASEASSLVVFLQIPPEAESVEVELNIPETVPGAWIALRGEEGVDFDMFGGWERPVAKAQRESAQYRCGLWSPDEDLVLRRGKTGPRELRAGTLCLSVVRPAPHVEPVLATMVVHGLLPTQPDPALWEDGHLFHAASAEEAQRIDAAQRAWCQGEAELALQGLKDLIARDPRHALFRAAMLGDMGRWEQLQADLEGLRDDPRAVIWLARGARAQGKAASAITSLEQAIARAPNLLRPRLELAECLIAAGRHEDASRAARKVLERDKWEGRAEVLDAVARLAGGEPTAVARLTALADKAGLPISAQERALDELLQRGEATKVAPILAGLLENYKRFPPALMALQAECLARLGRGDDGRKLLEEAEKQPMLPGTRARVAAIKARIEGLKR